MPGKLNTYVATQYQRVARILRNQGWVRKQYSVWNRNNITVLQAWHTMRLLITTLRPIGYPLVACKRLGISYIDNDAVWDITDLWRPGGILTPTTSYLPRNALMDRFVGGQFMDAVPGVFQVPRHVPQTPAAMDANNWAFIQ